MKANFEQLAAYNRWANARLYEATLALTGEGEHYHRGDIVIHEDRRSLGAARADEGQAV